MLLNVQRSFWSETIGANKVEFNGIPFSIGTKRLLDCQYDTQYKKLNTPTSSRMYLQGSKKGCRAHIEITEFILYPAEDAVTQIPSKPMSQKQTRKVREEMYVHIVSADTINLSHQNNADTI